MTSLTCLHCPAAMSRLNGRWCLLLNRLVQYSSVPPCQNPPTPNNPAPKK